MKPILNARFNSEIIKLGTSTQVGTSLRVFGFPNLAIFKNEQPYDDKFLEKRQRSNLKKRQFETSKVLDGSVFAT